MKFKRQLYNTNDALIMLSKAYVEAQALEHKNMIIDDIQRVIDQPIVIIDEDEK